MADSQSGIGPSISSWLTKLLFGKADEGLPRVDQPDSWYPEPFVTGGQDLANEVYSFNQKYPRAKKNVSSVTIGPTDASIRAMVDTKVRPGSYDGLLGIYSVPAYHSLENPLRPSIGNASIGINPSKYPVPSDDRSVTLGHEMGHALGINDEDVADIFGNKWASEYRKKKLSQLEQSEVNSFQKDPLIPEFSY